jgi:SLT domain-containing protein
MIQYRIQTRPRWMNTNNPAIITAKTVMASALRAMGVRHFARKRYRIAEIRVPEWAIPTQKTKLTR